MRYSSGEKIFHARIYRLIIVVAGGKGAACGSAFLDADNTILCGSKFQPLALIPKSFPKPVASVKQLLRTRPAKQSESSP
jgi:hypothetical protein